MKIIVTGGAGFIGSALIRFLIKNTNHNVMNIDKLTYAGNLESLFTINADDRYRFIKMDICDPQIEQLIFNYQPNIIFHLAAESHVDRSIEDPSVFLQTNILGTYNLLEACRKYYSTIKATENSFFRFHHISTDEVYGDLHSSYDLFTEATAYNPSSPYSASKASSDHLVRAWHRTYNLPIVITNCSNNYGPYQFPEKLIPLVVLKALKGDSLPIYGDGKRIRDWLYVDDHVEALYKVAVNGEIGETYNIGGHNEFENIEVVHEICRILDARAPKYYPHRDLIRHVTDRQGHDLRYAIDASKIEASLGWKPKETFATGLEKTVLWYLANQEWCQRISKADKG